MKRTAALMTALLASTVASADFMPYQIMKKYGDYYVTFYYSAGDEYSKLGNGTQCAISGLSSPASLYIESSIGGKPLKVISAYSCSSLSKMTGISIPVGVELIGNYAFQGCTGLSAIVLPINLAEIGNEAFSSCTGIKNIVIPSGVTNIGDKAFYNCTGLTNITFNGKMPLFGSDVFKNVTKGAKLEVKDPTGWDYYEKNGLVPPWNGLTVSGLEKDEPQTTGTFITITNIVIHYIQTSALSPMAAPISHDVGLVNIITEINGGSVTIPESWTNNYPMFHERFGSDFGKALTKQTGKRDAAGMPMMVWQDFVAGTDPTDEDDVFRASVTIVNGDPVISYTPELNAEENANRIYTKWGKSKLQDEAWIKIEDGHEGEYNFFKVSVEMK